MITVVSLSVCFEHQRFRRIGMLTRALRLSVFMSVLNQSPTKRFSPCRSFDSGGGGSGMAVMAKAMTPT